MRSVSLLAVGLALAISGEALAQSQSAPPSSGSSSMPGSSLPSSSNSMPSSSMPSSNLPAGTNAPSASSSGANTSATAGAPALSIGEPVKDNTGATIGSISSLTAGANGQQMAVIKMGTDTFQVPSDRLGAADGAAEINMTQAQISGMLHPPQGAGRPRPRPRAGPAALAIAAGRPRW
jgi:hypothetical protein